MLVFEDEVNELSCHDLYYVETVKEEPVPIEKLLEKVASALPDSISVTGVSISSDPELGLSGHSFQTTPCLFICRPVYG